MLQVYVKYSVCELIWEVFSRVFEAAIRVVNASDKIMIETQKKKRKYGNKIFFYKNLHLKDHVEIEFAACWSELMPEEALTSFTVSNAYRQFAGEA